MIALTRPAPSDTQPERFREVSRHDPCEVCGSDHWCMATSTTAMCMRVAEGSYRTKENSQGEEYYLHRRTGAAPPAPIRAVRRDERPDHERPDPFAYRAMLTELVRRCTSTPPPSAAKADRRRFGAHAEGVAAIADAGYLVDPHGFRRWLRDEGRDPQAKVCGLLTNADDLAPFLERKLFWWRDADGQVCDVRGRDFTGQAERKVLAPAGNREEKGCAGAFYQARQIRIAAAQGGHLYACGGHEKADSLIYAGLPTIGLNEGQISDAMLDVLRAEGIATLTILADGERPKILQDGTPAPHSQGQRLALRVAQRAEDAAICARLTEPERAPDGPKVDADSLLRDHGPEALRALVRAALPLALYRRKVGAEPDAAPLALVAELRDERDRERREKGEVIRELRVLRGTLANTAHKQLARAAIGIAAEVQERLTNTTDRGADIHIVKETGERFVRVNNGSAGRRVGLSDDTMGTAVKQLAKLGKLSKITRSAPGTFRDKTTGELKEGWIKQVFVSLPATDSTTWLEEQIVPLSPDKETPHWGRRPGLARCERHPDAPTKTTTTRTITCAECGEVLEQTITGETYQDQDGRPLTEGDIRRMAATKPKVSGVKDTNTEGGLEASDHAPVECRPPLPKVSVTPPPPIDLATHRPPRCMHCGERMPAGDARHYCPRCRADGWHDPRPPAAATGGADPPGDQVPAAGD